MSAMRWLLVLCLAWTLPTLAAETREQRFVVGADVNAQGEVTGTQPAPGTAKPFAALLDLALKHWRFVPAKRDGKAVTVHTFIVAKLDATPGDHGKYTVQITYVRHGPAGWGSAPAPHYPEASLHLHETGIVAMTGSLQPDGKLVIADTHSRTSSSSGNRSPLRKASADWLLQRVVMPETVDGQAVAATFRAFIVFNLNEAFGPPGSSADPPLSNEQKKLLLDAGFTDPGAGKDPVGWDISSVLQTSDVRPITLHLQN